VMGDTVNLASRLESANKVYGSRCLVSEATFAGGMDFIEGREIDRLVAVGQSQPQVVYEIMGRSGELSPAQISLRTYYSEGLAAYRSRKWEQARSALNKALETSPNDGPSKALLSRIESFQKNPPTGNWDGSWRLDQK